MPRCSGSFCSRYCCKLGVADVVQVLLAGGDGISGLQGADDGVLALIERRLAGFLDAQVDQDFVVGGRAEALDAGIVQAGAVHVVANLVEIGRLRELDVDQRAAAEVHTQRNVMPEQHGTDAGDAEDQREGKEIPLLAEEIDIGIAK